MFTFIGVGSGRIGRPIGPHKGPINFNPESTSMTLYTWVSVISSPPIWCKNLLLIYLNSIVYSTFNTYKGIPAVLRSYVLENCRESANGEIKSKRKYRG